MSSYKSLLARVKLVRRRWRSQALVKGISIFLASAIALLVLGVWGADLFGFRPAAVWFMRILTAGTAILVAWRFLYIPFRTRISDVQIAQFIEERYPQLEDRLVTAVEYGQEGIATSSMIDLLIKDALDKTNRVDFSVFVNRRRLAYFGLLGVGASLALLALLTWGPPFISYGINQLYVPWTQASFRSSTMIMVVPGDLEIIKGSDQQIKAQLVGFDSPDVQLYVQPENTEVWTSSAMELEPYGSDFRYLLIDVQSSLRYYVEADGVRSPTHFLQVYDLARVERIDLTYNFPAYTGMTPQVVENEGDISALKGTKVDLAVQLNQPAHSARLLFDDQATLDLSASGSQNFTGSITLQHSGSYVVQLAESAGKLYAGSSEYDIEVIEDKQPKVTVTKPMRDVRATNVEEVFSEVKAEDDIGMGKVELRYSVNGGSEKTINLHSGSPNESAVTAAHTFFLEEFDLQPGDLISYYAKAWDNNDVTGPGTASSDIYFIEIRPFEQKYTQSQQAPPQGGSGGEPQEELSKQQKEIISATFNQIRDKEALDPKEYLDNMEALSLVQSRLQNQTQGLVDRLRRRGAAEVDENFGKLSDYLQTAIAEMEKAAFSLGAQKPNEALPQENKALQQLLRAESLFRDIQVSFAAQQGSGSGSQADAEDLADLFELELNKLKNQYETVQRGEQQARDEKLDETLQRLKELAQRQQQLNERNRMMGQRAANSTSGSGSQSQQQLLEEAEELQRQLQRLSRERSSPQLNSASNRLQKAIEEMKKALKDSQGNESSQATAQGIRALQQLDEAMRELARSQEANLNQGLEQAIAESEKLLEEQNRIQEELDQLAEDQPQPGSTAQQRRSQDLVERKTVQADRLRNLEDTIGDLNRLARKTQKETSSKLADAANTIRDNRLPERIMSGNAMIENGYYDIAQQREDFIRSGLEDLNEQLEAAKDSIGESSEGKLAEAVDRARQLAEGLESMQQRLGEIQRGRAGSSTEQQQAQSEGQEGRQPGQSQSNQAREGQQASAQAQPGQGQQGQSGQQPGNSERSREAMGQGFPRSGSPSAETEVRGFSQNAAGPPTGLGRYRDEDLRQLQREYAERLMDAQDLRRLLDRNSTQMEYLDNVIKMLRRASDYEDFQDPEEIARLKSAIELMRQVELALSRDLDQLAKKDEYFFAGDNEAPINYRKLVEEYYKAIAKGQSE